MSLNLKSRTQWRARLRLSSSMPLPASGLHVHHSVTNSAPPWDACMRVIEDIGDDRFGRFSYSYCIHPSGVVAVGAGTTIGAHTAGYNSSSFGICFIGNFEREHPTGQALYAFRQLRGWLVSTGKLKPEHYIAPHRARKATSCPGQKIMDVWPHLSIKNLPPVEPEEEDDMPSADEVALVTVQAFEQSIARGGTSNDELRLAVTDALQMGLRQPKPGDDVRIVGALRDEFKDLMREVLAESR